MKEVEEPHGSGTEPHVRLAGVSKRYGSGSTSVDALRDVDLEVRRGQFVVILGPSGSGKTTLLNVVGGLESVTAGTVVCAGDQVSGLDAEGRTRYRRRRVGFVFQFFNLIPTLTAIENVALIAELTGPAARERASSALEAVGLADKADRFPGALSGGEQQRVTIARGLAKGVELLLCDEPTGALDLENGRRVLALLRETCERDGRTVLLVTHNSAIARVADRVLRLSSGRLAGDEANESPLAPERVEW